MRAFLLAPLLLLALPALADETGRPTAENCNVASPPDSAGELDDHGTTVKVFPRAKEIGPAYSGCQARWAQAKGGWTLSSLAVIAKGEAVRYWTPAVSFVTCIYDRSGGGQVVLGDPKTCPDPKSLILKSYPSGCVDRMRQRAGQAAGAAQVPGCDLQ